MEHKIITTEFKREGQTVKVSLKLIDVTNPLIVLGTTQVDLTIPNGINEAEKNLFVKNECLACVQHWYDDWKIENAKTVSNDTTGAGLETYINANIIL